MDRTRDMGNAEVERSTAISTRATVGQTDTQRQLQQSRGRKAAQGRAVKQQTEHGGRYDNSVAARGATECDDIQHTLTRGLNGMRVSNANDRQVAKSEVDQRSDAVNEWAGAAE